MARYWGKIIRKQKILQDTVTEVPSILNSEDFEQMIQKLCEPLDLPRPVILSKHLRDMAAFRRVRFLPGDFMEEVPFDSFEAEELIDKKKEGRF